MIKKMKAIVKEFTDAVKIITESGEEFLAVKEDFDFCKFYIYNNEIFKNLNDMIRKYFGFVEVKEIKKCY
jgi:hypothetical protein